MIDMALAEALDDRRQENAKSVRRGARLSAYLDAVRSRQVRSTSAINTG